MMLIALSLCGTNGCRRLAGHTGSHDQCPSEAWDFFLEKDKKKISKAGFATPRGGAKGAYQNHVVRSSKVIIPFERIADVELDLYKDGYVVRLLPDQSCSAIDIVVFPEAALSQGEDDLDIVLDTLAERGIPLLLAGVRGGRTNTVQLFELNRKEPTVFCQHKHHRWCIDSAQIAMYDLGFYLHPDKRWWEDIEVAPRTLQCFAVSEWLTCIPLICEDLARADPVAETIRRIGPNLVIALLQDGPQLVGRWPARYATVLADDPGSSVLTLTSLGMVLRSTSRGALPVSRKVALWKDRGGVRELELPEGAAGLLLSLSSSRNTEYSADGRSDGGHASNIVYSGHKAVFI